MTLGDKVDPAQAAVIVIDVQNDFVHADGALSKNGADIAAMQRMTGRLQTFIAQARAAGVPIVFVHSTHGPETDSEVWLERALLHLH